MIFVRPLNGVKVPYPKDGGQLPAGGAYVEDIPYWRRRIADGSVEIVPGVALPSFRVLDAPALSFASMADFTAYGAANYGVRPVWIAGQQYWCDGAKARIAENISKGRLITVVIGNSIAAAMHNVATYPLVQYNERAEQVFANALAGNCMEFPLIVPGPNGRSDNFGCYGYSGQTLNVITADLEAELFTPLTNAGIVPDLIYAAALLENDIGAEGASYATLVTRLTNFKNACNSQWPGVKFLLGTPRPSFSYNTTAKVTAWQQIVAYMLSIEDANTKFVYQPGLDYVDPNNPWLPIVNTVVGTVNNNVLTLTQAPNFVLKAGDLMAAGVAITDCTPANNTYTITGAIANNATPTTYNIYRYTDESVHPQGVATGLNARRAAEKLLQIAGVVRTDNLIVSANRTLTGSQAVANGTLPPPMADNGATAAATHTYLALNPGFRITYSNIADNANRQASGEVVFGNYTLPVPGVKQFKAFCRAKIVSGAENLKSFHLEYNMNDNGSWLPAGQPYNNVNATNAQAPEYQNGDELYLCTPFIESAGIGSHINIVQIRLVSFFKARCPAGASIVIEVYEQGIELPKKLSGRATLVAGAATIAAGALVKANSKITISRISAAGSPGALFNSARTPGTSFAITSTNAADTSVVEWEIQN